MKMTPTERTSVLSLAGIMSLRMLGLFMILPVFALYAHQLKGATPFLIGLAMGIYGLTQAVLQIPFGILSDHLGRKKIIVIGLFIFALGSVISALAKNIDCMIIGRALQGAGAIGSTIMALVADLTREDQRTKAMALIGMTIGMSFSLAMMTGPIFSNLIGVNGIFWLAVFFSVVAIFILWLKVPTPNMISFHSDAEPELNQFSHLLKHKELMRLNVGIFILHAIFTANFVVLPISLQNFAGLHGNQQWLLYLPILLLSFFAAIPFIIIAEKKNYLKKFFLGAIFFIGIAELLLWIFTKNLWMSALSLFLFFTAFTILEAFLPSLVSRAAPSKRKGTALGIYSFSQFMGIFAGGALGGWLYGSVGLQQVYLFSLALCVLWFASAISMKALRKH